MLKIKNINIFMLFLCMQFLGCTDTPKVSFDIVSEAEYGGRFFQGLGVYTVQNETNLRKAEFFTIKNGEEMLSRRVFYKNGKGIEYELLGGDVAGNMKVDYTEEGDVLSIDHVSGKVRTQVLYEYENNMRTRYEDGKIEYKEHLSSTNKEFILTREKENYKKVLRLKYKNGMITEWWDNDHKYVLTYANGKIKNLSSYIINSHEARLFGLYEVLYKGEYISEIDFYEFPIATREKKLVRKTFYEKYDSHGNWTESSVQGRNGVVQPFFKRVFEYED